MTRRLASGWAWPLGVAEERLRRGVPVPGLVPGGWSGGVGGWGAARLKSFDGMVCGGVLSGGLASVAVVTGGGVFGGRVFASVGADGEGLARRTDPPRP